jgi:hypothetical protein
MNTPMSGKGLTREIELRLDRVSPYRLGMALPPTRLIGFLYFANHLMIL